MSSLETTPQFLVCINASEESRIALKFACALAVKRQGRVQLLHIVPPPQEFQGFLTVADKIRNENREAGEKLVAERAEEAQKGSSITPVVSIREGKVADEILAAAESDPDTDMVIIGADPDSGHGHIVSQLAAQLGKRLLIPLLIVPGNLTDQQIQALV
ncbi:MAG: universal stress protein [Alphaproteobacteria bacterium]|nr:universal stress protein [Alphaproteobacteria bacterium]